MGHGVDELGGSSVLGRRVDSEISRSDRDGASGLRDVRHDTTVCSSGKSVNITVEINVSIANLLIFRSGQRSVPNVFIKGIIAIRMRMWNDVDDAFLTSGRQLAKGVDFDDVELSDSADGVVDIFLNSAGSDVVGRVSGRRGVLFSVNNFAQANVALRDSDICGKGMAIDFNSFVDLICECCFIRHLIRLKGSRCRSAGRFRVGYVFRILGFESVKSTGGNGVVSRC